MFFGISSIDMPPREPVEKNLFIVEDEKKQKDNSTARRCDSNAEHILLSIWLLWRLTRRLLWSKQKKTNNAPVLASS